MAEKWLLCHRDEISALEVQFPANTAPDPLPAYVSISSAGKTVFARTAMRRGASGKQIWVSRRILPKTADDQTVEIDSAEAWQYRLYRLLHDRGQVLTLAALGVAMTGLAIDASLAVGKVHPFWTASDARIAGWMITAFALKGAGLLVVFFRGILQGDA